MRALLFVALSLLLVGSGCSSDSVSGASAGPPRTPVTVVQPEIRSVEDIERSVGRLSSPEVPLLRAEAAGRVVDIRVDAGSRVEPGALLIQLDDEVQRLRVAQAEAALARIQAQLAQAERTRARQRELAAQRLVAPSAVEEAEAAVDTLAAQRREAELALEQARWALRQTRIHSPLAAVVQQRRVAVGDLVQVGEPVLELVAAEQLRAVLPFPETLLGRIQRGQPVRLALPEAPADEVAGRVDEIRPLIGAGSRAIEVIVGLTNPGDWKVGGSVIGTLVLETRPAAVVVPGAAVVQRPAGSVVYVLDGDQVRERVVRTGVAREGWVEILAGLDGQERVVLRGAGFLTDGAFVDVRETGG